MLSEGRMALQAVLKGVHQIYRNSQNLEENATLHSDRNSCSNLLPQVRISRLRPQAIEQLAMRTPLLNNGKEEFLTLFGEEEGDSDGYPFLGFGLYGEPTVQIPTLTRSSKKAVENSTCRKEGEKSATMKSLTMPTPDNQRNPVSFKKRSSKKKPKHIIYKERSPSCTASHIKAKTNAVTKVTEKVFREDAPQPTENIIQQDGLPVGAFSDLDLQLMSIKNEIDDSDITIEDEVFDCSSYNVTETILSPSSERLQSISSEHQQDSFSSRLNNSTSSSKNSSCFIFRENPNRTQNGINKPSDLTELTTLLLELNNKNNELDKKLAILKKDYETKVAKIQVEKKNNERKIEQTLHKIQNWRDNGDGGCIDSSSSSLLHSTTGMSAQAEDFQRATKRRTTSARKRIGKTRKKGTKYESVNSDQVHAVNKVNDKKSRTNCHDPEPVVSDSDMYEEDLFEYEDSGSVDSIDAEIVCLSDLYKPQKKDNSNEVNDVLGAQNEKKSNVSKSLKTLKQSSNSVMQSISNFNPVVCLSDIYAKKKISEDVGIENVKCGSYVVIRLASKKTIKHYCAVVRNKTESGDCGVQYMEKKKGMEFIFPEKETIYNIEDSDIVKVLQEPLVKVKGLRLYYSFSDNLDKIASLM